MLRIKVKEVIFTDGQLAQQEDKFNQPLYNIAEAMVVRPVALEHGHVNKDLTNQAFKFANGLILV